MNEREQTFYFSLKARPKLVRVDPGMQVLKSMDFTRPAEMLREQLAHDDDVLGRIGAARALAKKGDLEAIRALGKALREDSFWSVSAEAARALGSIRAGAALDELLTSVSVPEPRVRRAIATALGEFREPRAAEALERIIQDGDASYYVEAGAAAAIGKTRQPGALAAIEHALGKNSQNEVIRSSAMSGLAELRDPKALPVVMEWTKYGKPQQVRAAATAALGRFAEFVPDVDKSDIVYRLTELLEDSWFRNQASAIDALKETKDPKAIPALQRTAERELDGRIIRMARDAVQKLRQGAEKGEDLKKLREEVDKLVDENRSLRDRLDKLEARAEESASTPAV
jgi:aminopeptidase N